MMLLLLGCAGDDLGPTKETLIVDEGYGCIDYTVPEVLVDFERCEDDCTDYADRTCEAVLEGDALVVTASTTRFFQRDFENGCADICWPVYARCPLPDGWDGAATTTYAGQPLLDCADLPLEATYGSY